jgi:hypothetical protein
MAETGSRLALPAASRRPGDDRWTGRLRRHRVSWRYQWRRRRLDHDEEIVEENFEVFGTAAVTKRGAAKLAG